MWVLELIAGLLGASYPGGGPDLDGNRSLEQNLSMGIGSVGFPILGFCLVLFADLWQNPDVALIVLPAASTLLAALLSTWLVRQSSWTLRVSFQTAVAAWAACATACLLGGLTGFYSAF